eukprot:TRINITY_DN46470_c0_g1_i1.p2 TRINITY_DN46470_c0_g1~~TRINITY_DN46470_c0_g1_i1.p2  ORF type:complete len:456 (+),score=144.67 TRINITY_DN46470_c0_g1_i1:165-1370(+)
MYGGYVDIGDDKAIYYWMVESQRDPDTDPLVIWTNGGPGCSGLNGFLTEQGPFRPTENGHLEMNPHSWNLISNMVFIEQPAGVGFSPAPPGLAYNDSQSAEDNHKFILGFLDIYPKYRQRDLYLSSESYGGHYLPVLAKLLLDEGDVPTFKGIFLGNPMTSMQHRFFGEFGTLIGHNLVPKPLGDEYMAAECDKNAFTQTCVQLQTKMYLMTKDLDPYALSFPTCNSAALSVGRHERHTLVQHLKAGGARYSEEYEPCAKDYAKTYLNRADVQEAIHVRTLTNWQGCAKLNYSQYDVYQVSMVPVWEELIATKALKIVIYSGDDDSICPTLGTQQWIWGMGLEIKSEWHQWFVDGQVAGFITEFDGFTFATVRGAGHMVPSTRPAQALDLFTQFLEGDLGN